MLKQIGPPKAYVRWGGGGRGQLTKPAGSRTTSRAALARSRSAATPPWRQSLSLPLAWPARAPRRAHRAAVQVRCPPHSLVTVGTAGPDPWPATVRTRRFEAQCAAGAASLQAALKLARVYAQLSAADPFILSVKCERRAAARRDSALRGVGGPASRAPD